MTCCFEDGFLYAYAQKTEAISSLYARYSEIFRIILRHFTIYSLLEVEVPDMCERTSADRKIIEEHQQRLKESLKFFSNDMKPERERWVCREFLENLGIEVSDKESIRQRTFVE